MRGGVGGGASGFPQSHCMFLPAWFSHLNLWEGWAWRWETPAWSLGAPSPSRCPPPNPRRHLPSLGPLAWKESLVSPLWKGWFRGHSEPPAGLGRLFQGAGSISSSQFPVGWRPSPGFWLMPRPGALEGLEQSVPSSWSCFPFCPPPLPRGTGRWGLPSERRRGWWESGGRKPGLRQSSVAYQRGAQWV